MFTKRLRGGVKEGDDGRVRREIEVDQEEGEHLEVRGRVSRDSRATAAPIKLHVVLDAAPASLA